MDHPTRIAVGDAIELVRGAVAELPSERVAARGAAGRVLAEALAARADHPTVDNSALDGYACRVADTEGATAEAPATLRVIGEVPAGRPFAGALGPGEAVAIYTGGAVPAGADGIVPVETTRREGERVLLLRPARSGDIRPAAQDLRAGATYLEAGRRLDAGALALVAAMGHARVTVARRPRVALLTTGDEVVAPGGELAPGQVFDANGPALRALLERAGAEVVELPRGADTVAALEASLAEVRGGAAGDGAVDLIVSSGGVSMGGRDAVRDLLLAGRVHFWKLRMKPGGPVLFAEHRGAPWLGLPGNPVSSPVAFVLIGIPLLRALTGERGPLPYERRRWARAAAPLAAAGDRETFLRVTLDEDREGAAPGLPRAVPVRSQSSGVLSSLVAADALAVLAPGRRVGAGEPVPVIPLAPYFG